MDSREKGRKIRIMPTLAKPKQDTETKDEVKNAPRYKVIFHNDDKTTMEFVIKVLIECFRKKPEEAFEIMMSVHKKGLEVVGVYGKEEAEFRVDMATSMAKTAKYPLKITMEPDV